MSSPPDNAAVAPPRPTIFISYASEDRAAARQLRDTLDAAGLDVWYDENELGGGDAWDQKIRRQIRDCEYFMPVISATTEQRREGYFRREWRLATDRSLDMADDVLFLIPVTIDGTSENGARVPDKFLTVQWLRLPGGQPTPALHHLVRRILSGDHHPLTRPPMAFTRPPLPTGSAPPVEPLPPPHDGPPPMPAFPHLAATHTLGDRFRFFAEILWWVLTAGWLLFRRLPRWARVLLTIWVVFWFVAQCNSGRRSTADRESDPAATAVEKAKTRKAIRAAAAKIAEAAKSGDSDGTPGQLAQLGTKLAHDLTEGVKHSELAGKELVAVPFALGVTDEKDAKFLGAVFTPLYGRLAIERAGETGTAPDPLATATDKSLLDLGHRLAADYTLGAWITRTGDNATLIVRLMRVEDDSVAWSGEYPVAGSEPASVSDRIASGVLAAVPKE